MTGVKSPYVLGKPIEDSRSSSGSREFSDLGIEVY